MPELDTQTKIMNTFLNPLTTDTWTPQWLKDMSPLGKSYDRETGILFHAAALLATYGAAGYGVRKLQTLWGDTKQKDKMNKIIKEHTKSSMPVLSPDPDIRDVEGVDLKKNPMLKQANEDDPAEVAKKNLEENQEKGFYRAAISAGGLLIPALAAYTGYMYGYEKADDHEDKSQIARNEKVINKLENIYQKANMERLLQSKGYTPAEIAQIKQQMMSKTAEEDAGVQAFKDTMNEEHPELMTSEEKAKKDAEDESFFGLGKYLTPAIMLTTLTVGGLSYASYKIGKDYLEKQDPERLKVKRIKKELNRRMTNKQPTTLIANFDPKLKALLDTPTKKNTERAAPKKVAPVLESVPSEEAESNLADLLNTT